MEQFLNKLSMGSKIGIGGFILGFISCLLPWYSVSFELGDLGRITGMPRGQSWNAMSSMGGGIGGVLFLLFCMGGVVVAVLPAVVENDQFNKPPLGFAILGVAGVALLSALIGMASAGSGMTMSGPNVSAGMSFGWYLALIAALVALAGGALRAKELNLLSSGGSPTDAAPPPPPPVPPAEPM